MSRRPRKLSGAERLRRRRQREDARWRQGFEQADVDARVRAAGALVDRVEEVVERAPKSRMRAWAARHDAGTVFGLAVLVGLPLAAGIAIWLGRLADVAP